MPCFVKVGHAALLTCEQHYKANRDGGKSSEVRKGQTKDVLQVPLFPTFIAGV